MWSLKSCYEEVNSCEYKMSHIHTTMKGNAYNMTSQLHFFKKVKFSLGYSCY